MVNETKDEEMICGLTADERDVLKFFEEIAQYEVPVLLRLPECCGSVRAPRRLHFLGPSPVRRANRLGLRAESKKDRHPRERACLPTGSSRRPRSG